MAGKRNFHQLAPASPLNPALCHFLCKPSQHSRIEPALNKPSRGSRGSLWRTRPNIFLRTRRRTRKKATPLLQIPPRPCTVSPYPPALHTSPSTTWTTHSTLGNKTFTPALSTLFMKVFPPRSKPAPHTSRLPPKPYAASAAKRRISETKNRSTSSPSSPPLPLLWEWYSGSGGQDHERPYHKQPRQRSP